MNFKPAFQILGFCVAGILLIIFLNNSVQAQPEKSIRLKGKTELSAAFSFQSVKQKEASEGSWILTLPLQTRYFLTQNIGIGAELIFTDGKGEQNTGYILNGIVEAAFPTPDGIIPFLNAGYGISNGSFPIDRLALKNYEDVTLGVLNLGAGIRIPFGEKVFGKTEVRYQRFTGEYKYDTFFGTQTIDLGTTYINVLFGLSLLL
jgi:hypothetical protein